MILILDFGSQYTHLISRRIRERGVYSEIRRYDISLEEIERLSPSAVVLSGGPMSVYMENAPFPRFDIFSLKKPILAICYGAQLVAYLGGGKVKRGVGEYGRARIELKSEEIFEGIPREIYVWMSHGDVIEELPRGGKKLASSEFSPYAAFSLKNIYCVQFHPEVKHTEYGEKIIENFIRIAKAERDWNLEKFLEEKIEEVRGIKGSVLCAVSGGVDSTVLSKLLSFSKAKVHFIFVDTGLLRDGEVDEVKKNFERIGINIEILDEKRRFMKMLKGVSSPEKKRKIIGMVFGNIFKDIIKQRGIEVLAQGTLYPDVIESGRGLGPAKTIKTHHNVGGLPKLPVEIFEPLRNLYKDEVRRIGEILGIPKDILYRFPFPGPGLAVRIIGRITDEKLEILRRADKILMEEFKKLEFDIVWQVFSVLLNTKSTGVVGDRRRYGYVLAIRCVSSTDAMTADWVRLPYEFLDTVARRITGEVPEISRVVYDITSKPPATIEWE